MKKLTQSRGTGLALAAVGVLMMAFGIYRGEMMVVLTKAVNICMECIGKEHKDKKLAAPYDSDSMGGVDELACIWFCNRENIYGKNEKCMCTWSELLFLSRCDGSLSHWIASGSYWKLEL